MKSVPVIEVEPKVYDEYQSLRSSVYSFSSEVDKQRMIELHLRIFYPGLFDKNKMMIPPAVFFVKPDETISPSDKKGKNGTIRVRHPLLR